MDNTINKSNIMNKRKRFFGLLAVLMLALVSVGFASCGDDDDEDNEDAIYDAITDWLTKKYGKGKYRATNIELEWC